MAMGSYTRDTRRATLSFFREADRTLIAGDAFVTTKQESAVAALTQRPEMHGPPTYFTPDWENARRSVERLAALGAPSHHYRPRAPDAGGQVC